MREIRGRCAQVHTSWCQAGGDQSRVLQPAQANGQVETLMHQVQRAIAQFNVDP